MRYLEFFKIITTFKDQPLKDNASRIINILSNQSEDRLVSFLFLKNAANPADSLEDKSSTSYVFNFVSLTHFLFSHIVLCTSSASPPTYLGIVCVCVCVCFNLSAFKSSSAWRLNITAEHNC